MLAKNRPKSRVLLCIARRSRVDPQLIEPGDRLVELGIGSLQFLELILEIEADLKLELVDDEIEQVMCCATAGRVCDTFLEIVNRRKRASSKFD
jgi:acyl carrier protein